MDLDKAAALAAALEAQEIPARAGPRTMILVDANVLIHAVNADAPQHTAARARQAT